MKKIYSLLLLCALFSFRSTAAISGDYRSDLLTGDWSNTLTWLKFNGLLWLTDLSYPGQFQAAGNVEITSGRTVNINATPAYPIGSLTITSGTLRFNSTTGRTITINGNTVLSGTGNISIVNTAGANVHTLNLVGSLTLANGTSIDMVNGDDVANVFFTGAGDQSININGATASARFNELTVNKTTAATAITSNTYPFTVKNNLTVTSGNLILAATADLPYTTENDLTVASGSKLTHNISYNDGNKLLKVGGNLSISGSYVYTGYLPAINMYGAGTHYIRTGSSALCKLFLLNGDFFANGNVTVQADLYAMWNNASGSFHTNGQTVAANWGLVNSGGSVYVDGGSLTVGNTIAGLLSGNTGSYNGNVIVSSGTLSAPAIQLGKDAASPATSGIFTESGGTVTAATIQIGLNSSYTSSGGDAIVNGNLTLGYASSNYINNGASVLKINGDFINTGTYTAANSSVIELTGNWINNGTCSPSATSKVIFKGTTDQSIGGTNPSVFNHLVLNPSASKTVTANNNITIKNNLELLSGTFDQLNKTVNRQTTGGIFSMAANTVHRVSGVSGGACSMNNFPANFSVYNFDATSTTRYAASADQQICSAPVYGHLQLENAGTKIAGSGTIEVKGNFVNIAPSLFDANAGIIRLTGTNQQFAGVQYASLELMNGGIKTLTAAGKIQKQLLVDVSTTLALGNNDLSLLSVNNMTANVAEIPSSASITYGTGRFIVERYMPAKKAWRFISTPVKAGMKIYDTWQEAGVTTAGRGLQITGPLANPAGNGLDVVSVSSSMKYYNPAAIDGFTGISNTRTTDLANEKGYMIFVRGDRTATIASGINNTTVLRTKGELITGTKNYSVPANGLASVGNPYASRIDLQKVYDNNGIGTTSGVTASVIVWDPNGGVNGVGRYETYTRNNSGNFELTPVGTVNNFIESGQAFYVQSATGGTLTLQENVKVNGSSNASRDATSVMTRLRTNLFTPDPDSAWALIDGTLTDTDPEYSNNIDNMDVRKTKNKDENFGIFSGGKLLIVERRKPFSVTDTIVYNMTGMKTHAYRVEFQPMNISAGLNAFLEDGYLNTSTAISLTSNTNVDFEITSATASYAINRFRIFFSPAIVLPVKIVSVSAHRENNGNILINWKTENEVNIEKYTVERSIDGISFTGILTAAPTGSSFYIKADESPLPSDNFYRIKVQNAGGQVQYSAIVKVAAEKSNPQISVYPNPVAGKKMDVHFTSQPKGNYQLQLTNKLGQLVYKGTVHVTTSSMVKSVQLDENIPAGMYQLTLAREGEKGATMQVVLK